MIIGLGDYLGGELGIIDSKTKVKREINIKNKFVSFDGSDVHFTLPFTGTRYSLVYFTIDVKSTRPP